MSEGNREEKQRLMIGPLALKLETPLNIYNSLVCIIEDKVSRIDRKYTTQLNFEGYGRFNRHIEAIEDALQWLNRYEIQMLSTLNCSHNYLPTLKYITLFYLPRLETLDLFDCHIESIQLLRDCFFPNILNIILYNNHITSLKPLRKCWIPFLNTLIVDSNLISEISSLFQLCSVHLQCLQIHNNQITDIRPMFKVKFPSLNQIRYDSQESCSAIKKSQIEQKIQRKFNSL